MRITINDIKDMKGRGEKIAMLTAYDYSSAKILDEAGVPIILVGDSLGMVMLGYDSTIPVTMEEMLHHTRAVARGAKRAMVIGDMPFMTFQLSPTQALQNAARFLQEGSANAVKLEGGEHMAESVRFIVQRGIPVQGHIGLTPQSINQLGGFRVQGKTREAAHKLLRDAIALEEAGVFSLVLESIPSPLARLISQRLKIPTIGIGAGPGCDGQVQVFHDMLGLYPDFVPKHAKQYAKMGQVIKDAVTAYIQEVKEVTFPTAKESYTMDEELLKGLEVE